MRREDLARDATPLCTRSNRVEGIIIRSEARGDVLDSAHVTPPSRSTPSIANARWRTSISSFLAHQDQLIRDAGLAVIERANALQPVRWLEYFSMAQSLNGIAISGEPVFFHRPPGELVIHGAALIFLCAIDQLNDVADFLIRLGSQQRHLRKTAQLIRKPLKQGREGDAQLLCVLV